MGLQTHHSLRVSAVDTHTVIHPPPWNLQVFCLLHSRRMKSVKQNNLLIFKTTLWLRWSVVVVKLRGGKEAEEEEEGSEDFAVSWGVVRQSPVCQPASEAGARLSLSLYPSAAITGGLTSESVRLGDFRGIRVNSVASISVVNFSSLALRS